MALVTRQPMVNDTGPGTDGTVGNKAFFDQIYDQVDDQCHDAGNPLVKPKATTAEVVTARGTCASLDARLDVSLNEDGTPKAVAGQANYGDLANIIGYNNCLGNDDYQIWAAGDTAAPTLWVLAGAGATIQRCGVGLADVRRKIGEFCARITRNGVDATLTQTLLSAASFPKADFLKGAYILLGGWVWTAAGNLARLSVDDGTTITHTPYHTGNSTWQFLTIPHPVSGAATRLNVVCEVNNSNNDAYFSGITAIPASGSYNLTDWKPCPVGYGFIQLDLPGTLSNATDVRRTSFHRPGIIKDIQAYLKTAAGTSINFDVLTNTDATPTFVTALGATIALGAAKFAGSQNFSATYARRCLQGAFGAAPAASSLISLDISNVVGPPAPADGHVVIRIQVYNRPFERFIAYNE